MESRDVQAGFESESGASGVFTAGDVSCLVTHKCPKDHDFVEFIRPVFISHSVNLLRDPFDPGVEVLARIQSLEYQALLFLFSSESWTSEYCQAELSAAQSVSVPIFSISRSGELPKSLRDRIFLVCEAGSEARMPDELHGLAEAVYVRGSIRTLLDKLRFPNTPETVRYAAERLADEPDCTALTEFLDCVERIYTRQIDPIARASLAFAVGKTGTQKAKQILLGWRSPDDHPYPQECISLALEWVKNKQTYNTGGNT
jgi:hypothetical protein